MTASPRNQTCDELAPAERLATTAVISNAQYASPTQSFKPRARLWQEDCQARPQPPFISQISIALPVSRKDFMLESTSGQPWETLSFITEPGLKSPWTTLRRTMSLTGSISSVTRDSSAVSSGSAQVNTRRLGGTLSRTLPTQYASLSSSSETCFHWEPSFQSETFELPPQYWRANFGSVIALQ